MCVQGTDMYSYPFNIHVYRSDNSKINFENAKILRSAAILLILFVLCFRPWPWSSLCGRQWCLSLEMDVVGARLRQNEVRNNVIQF